MSGVRARGSGVDSGTGAPNASHRALGALPICRAIAAGTAPVLPPAEFK